MKTVSFFLYTLVTISSLNACWPRTHAVKSSITRSSVSTGTDSSAESYSYGIIALDLLHNSIKVCIDSGHTNLDEFKKDLQSCTEGFLAPENILAIYNAYQKTLLTTMTEDSVKKNILKIRTKFQTAYHKINVLVNLCLIALNPLQLRDCLADSLA